MYQYPYGNAQQLNLDWILNKLKELEAGSGATLEEVSNALIALNYAEQNYNLSDIVFHNGKLYSANQNITAEPWNPDHWNEVLLANPVSNLIRYVLALNNSQVYNSSNVAGTHTSDALNNLDSDISDLAALRAKMGAKNLLPFPYEEDTKTTHGITYTVNSDSSITINGINTHSEMVHFNLSLGINWSGYRLHLIYSTPDNNISMHYNNNVRALSLDVSYQATINNVTVYPMVLDPTETVLNPFEKYAKTNVQLTEDVGNLNDALNAKIFTKTVTFSTSAITSTNPITDSKFTANTRLIGYQFINSSNQEVGDILANLTTNTSAGSCAVTLDKGYSAGSAVLIFGNP